MADGLPEPWWTPDARRLQSLNAELMRELSEGHPLFAAEVEVVNECGGCDDVAVRVGEDDFGIVHLTWSGGPERAPWPRYTHTGGFVATESAQTLHGQEH